MRIVRACSLLLCVGAATVAGRAAAAPPAPSAPLVKKAPASGPAAAPTGVPAAADDPRAGVLVRDARKAQGRGDHAAAMRLFEQALLLRRDDAALQSDLGWSALQAGDLARAESATRAAIAGETRPALRAASLYNLGRILEARGNRAGAIQAYRESLTLRPHAVVQRQLATLDPAAAAAQSPLRPQAMVGPLATMRDVCGSIHGATPPASCSTPDAVRQSVAQPAAPFRGVTLLSAGDIDCYLIVQLATGFYRSRQGIACDEPGFLEFQVQELAVRALLPGGMQAVLSWKSTRYTREPVEIDDGAGHTVSRNATVDDGTEGEQWICGVGNSGVPSCVQFPLLRRGGDGCKGGVCRDWQMDVTVSEQGELLLSPQGRPPADAQAYAGRHRIQFP